MIDTRSLEILLGDERLADRVFLGRRLHGLAGEKALTDAASVIDGINGGTCLPPGTTRPHSRRRGPFFEIKIKRI